MKTVLTAGLDADRAKEVRGDFKSSLLLRHRLVEVLKDKIETNRAAMRDKMSYKTPSWSHMSADSYGYERAVFELISLLEE